METKRNILKVQGLKWIKVESIRAKIRFKPGFKSLSSFNTFVHLFDFGQSKGFPPQKHWSKLIIVLLDLLLMGRAQTSVVRFCIGSFCCVLNHCLYHRMAMSRIILPELKHARQLQWTTREKESYSLICWMIVWTKYGPLPLNKECSCAVMWTLTPLLMARIWTP